MAVRKYTPGRKERDRLRAEHAHVEAVMNFWFEHHDELLALYPERYVAVKNPLGDYEVVASDRTIVTLLDNVAAMGLDRRDLEIEKVTARVRAPMPLLVPAR